MNQRVAVIGAGSSGLVCLKELLAEGHTATAFEARDDIGGVFRSSRDGGRSYASMRLTSSNYVTAFSDLPPEEREPCHWRHDQYLAYLHRYAAQFDLLRHVRFGTRIARVEPHKRGWRVTSVGPDGEVVEDYDAVAICSGVVQRPSIPDCPGLASFGGAVLHSADYHDAAPFAGKRVIVIGGGETAVDLVNEVSMVAEACHLSLRDGQWIIPRKVNGAPNDFHTSRLLHGLPRPMLNGLSRLRAEVQLGWSRLPLAGRLVSPATALRARLLSEAGRGCFAQFAVKSEAMIRPLLEGRCVRRGPIARFEPGAVVFESGERVEVDVALFCTGYRQSFDFLGDLSVDYGRLYRRCFTPEHQETLAFIGFARPAIGAIPPIAEMQSRWLALLLSGRRQLPGRERMRAVGAEELAARRAQFGELADRLQALIDYAPYQDALASEIGCCPDLYAIARREPRLAWKLFAGPFLGAQFRLSGPHATPETSRATLARVQPALTRPFMVFLLICHLFAVIGAALGVRRWRPALRIGERRAALWRRAPTAGLGSPAGHARNG